MLLCEWVSKLSEAETADRMAWLWLDEDDDEPARFLVYVVADWKTLEADNGDAKLPT